MIRVVVTYGREPDAARYARHAALCRKVPGGTFAHGRVFASPVGELRFAYVAEWSFLDRETFKAAVRSPEFAASGADAAAMGIPFSVHFVDLE